METPAEKQPNSSFFFFFNSSAQQGACLHRNPPHGFIAICCTSLLTANRSSVHDDTIECVRSSQTSTATKREPTGLALTEQNAALVRQHPLSKKQKNKVHLNPGNRLVWLGNLNTSWRCLSNTAAAPSPSLTINRQSLRANIPMGLS